MIPLISRFEYSGNIEEEENSVSILIGHSVNLYICKILPDKYKSFIPQYLFSEKMNVKNVDVMNMVHIKDYIARSKFVVTKTGYSTVAECIAMKILMIEIRKRNCIEYETISKWIEKYCIGIFIYYNEWDKEVIDDFNYEKYRKYFNNLLERFNNNG